MYYHSLAQDVTGVVLESINTPLLVQDGQGNTIALNYSSTYNQFALTGYNNTTEAGMNKLYLASNQGDAVRMYAFDVTETGIAAGALQYEFKDMQLNGNGELVANNALQAQLDLTSMQISRKGEYVAVGVTSGSETGNGLDHNIHMFALDAQPGNVSLAYDRKLTVGTESRPLDATGAKVQSGLKSNLKANILSFDFAPREEGQQNPEVKHIFYNQNKEQTLGNTTTETWELNRVKINGGVIENVDGGTGRIEKGEVRRGRENKLFVNQKVMEGGLEKVRNRLDSYEQLNQAPGLIKGSYAPIDLIESKNAGGLPLQALQIFDRLPKIPGSGTNPNQEPDPVVGVTLCYQREVGSKVYEMSDHLGNALSAVMKWRRMRVVFTDQREAVDNGGVLASNLAVVSFNDYYAFGMLQPGRTVSSDDYRYGFNGKEKDSEWNSGNVYDYGFRIYDPRIAKFLSVDPLSPDYPWNSPYSFAEGDVIRSIDLDGLEKFDMTFNLFIPFDKVLIAPPIPIRIGPRAPRLGPFPNPINRIGIYVPTPPVYVHGDNRSFDLSGKSDKFRVQAKLSFDVDNMQSGTMDRKVNTNESVYFTDVGDYHKVIYRKTAKDGDGANAKFTAKVFDVGNLRYVRIDLTLSGNIPFPGPINPSPTINISGSIYLTKNLKTGEITYSSTINLDGFPASEFFVSVDGGSPIPILLYTPTSEVEASSLLPVLGDRTVNQKPVNLGTFKGVNVITSDDP